MTVGINKAILVGRLGCDPQIKRPNENFCTAKFSLATTESWRDKKTNNQESATEWHNVVVYNSLAKICEKYLKKGSKVYVEGVIKTRKYQDHDGSEKYITEIIGKQLQMLDSKKEGYTSHNAVHYSRENIPF